MLSNGLGEVIRDSVADGSRFVDLFTGSGAVAVHVATTFNIPVYAADLQAFSIVLAGAVLERDAAIVPEAIIDPWFKRANRWISQRDQASLFGELTTNKVMRARSWSERQQDGALTSAYGGHYFSPLQARWLDAFRETLPRGKGERLVALAALVQAASRCAASPGHTAQPFQPTATAIKFLADAWKRDIPDYVAASVRHLSSKHARTAGKASIGNCLDEARKTGVGDVVFIDPPYSGVHYSRFYHVLESVVTRRCVEVSGVGRYPDIKFRPSSDFSMKGTSFAAMDSLLREIAVRGASAIITFPDHECSNGLSGDLIRQIAQKYFLVSEKVVESRFSTLGGTRSQENGEGNNRAARQMASELILSLRTM